MIDNELFSTGAAFQSSSVLGREKDGGRRRTDKIQGKNFPYCPIDVLGMKINNMHLLYILDFVYFIHTLIHDWGFLMYFIGLFIQTLPPIKQLSPDERKALESRKKKKDSELWEKPSPPVPFLLHLGLTARTHDIREFQATFPEEYSNYFVDR